MTSDCNTLSQQLKMLAWLPRDRTDSLCDCPVLWDSAGSYTGWVFSGTFWPPSPMWSSNKPQQPLHIPGMLCWLHQLQLGRIAAQLGKFGGTAHMFKTESFLLQTNCKYSWKQLYLYKKAYSTNSWELTISELWHSFIYVIWKGTKTDVQLMHNVPF